MAPFSLAIPRSIMASSAPVSVPATYLAFFDHMDAYAKLAGLVVIVLQGVLVALKIKKEMKGKSTSETDN